MSDEFTTNENGSKTPEETNFQDYTAPENEIVQNETSQMTQEQPEFFEKYTGKGIGNNGKKRTARKQTWVYYALGRMCNRMRKCMEVSLDVRTKRRWQFHACLCDLSAHFRASGNGDGTFRRTCGTDKSLVYV